MGAGQLTLDIARNQIRVLYNNNLKKDQQIQQLQEKSEMLDSLARKRLATIQQLQEENKKLKEHNKFKYESFTQYEKEIRELKEENEKLKEFLFDNELCLDFALWKKTRRDDG